MRTMIAAAVLLPMLLTAIPASAATREQIRAECIAQSRGYTWREAVRTGVSRQQKTKACVQERMRASKGQKS